MRWAAANVPTTHFVVTAAADTPFFPADLVVRLSQGCGKHEDMVAVAASGEGAQPVFARWPVRLADELEAYLGRGERKILGFADRFIRLNVPFDDIHLPDGEAVDPFFNVNTPEDAARAEKIAAAIESNRA
jgi:molybdopterin-guanine dinucleotide biosynthesis protein A